TDRCEDCWGRTRRRTEQAHRFSNRPLRMAASRTVVRPRRIARKGAGLGRTAKQTHYRPGFGPRAGDGRCRCCNAGPAPIGDASMWLTSVFDSLKGRSRRRRPRRGRRNVHRWLGLEALEDRNLMSFSSITSYAAGLAPYAIATGHFDAGDTLDLAVVNRGGSS